MCVLLCFIDPRVTKIRNEASSCPGVFYRTLHFAPLVLPSRIFMMNTHPGRIECNPTRSCPRPVGYHWENIHQRVSSTFRRNTRNDHRDSTTTTPTYYHALRRLNHHTHPTLNLSQNTGQKDSVTTYENSVPN